MQEPEQPQPQQLPAEYRYLGRRDMVLTTAFIALEVKFNDVTEVVYIADPYVGLGDEEQAADALVAKVIPIIEEEVKQVHGVDTVTITRKDGHLDRDAIGFASPPSK